MFIRGLDEYIMPLDDLMKVLMDDSNAISEERKKVNGNFLLGSKVMS